MVTSKVGKRHALTGFEALKELFIQRFVVFSLLSLLIQICYVFDIVAALDAQLSCKFHALFVAACCPIVS